MPRKRCAAKLCVYPPPIWTKRPCQLVEPKADRHCRKETVIETHTKRRDPISSDIDTPTIISAAVFDESTTSSNPLLLRERPFVAQVQAQCSFRPEARGMVGPTTDARRRRRGSRVTALEGGEGLRASLDGVACAFLFFVVCSFYYALSKFSTTECAASHALAASCHSDERLHEPILPYQRACLPSLIFALIVRRINALIVRRVNFTSD